MPSKKQPSSLADLTDHGERVTHLFANDCYYAHLALYDFARPFCQGLDVLDAGSGAGYGAAFLAQNGARAVLGIDLSHKAVAFSQVSFPYPNLRFRAVALETLAAEAAGSFDFIYCSNVLEHVADVPSFLEAAVRLLRPQGRALIAVPAITSAAHRAADLANPYHLNSWSPQQWQHMLGQFWEQLQPYGHYFEHPNYGLNFGNFPHETRITEKDFVFRPTPIEAFERGNSLTAIFLVATPKPAAEPRSLTFIDDSVSRPPPSRPPARARLLAAFQTGWRIWRQHGLQIFFRELKGFLQREWAVRRLRF